ncbi:MAG: hypothetical protein JWO31_2835 [Phycisphaerales bacterium]|nr:hypothetical protein [Phycisphaerales bacterium]
MGRTADRKDRGGLPGAMIPDSNRKQGRIRVPGGTVKPAYAGVPAWVSRREWP